jgi:hypothetical protein
MDEPFPKSPPLAPKDHAEAVARFRSEIVGALTRKDLHRGELRATLRALSQERFRPPGSDITRSFSVTTLERWLYFDCARSRHHLLRRAQPLRSPSVAASVLVADELAGDEVRDGGRRYWRIVE